MKKTSQKKTIKKIYNVHSVDTYIQKVKGLLGSSPSSKLYFTTRWGIHTFGMRFPIDVVILDDFHVVRITKQNLKPNQVFVWNPIYKHVLELPLGTIKENKININDKLVFYP